METTTSISNHTANRSYIELLQKTPLSFKKMNIRSVETTDHFEDDHIKVVCFEGL